MTTYKIFFHTFGSWLAYQDDYKHDIELLSLSAAQTIAKDLAASSEIHPPMDKDWYIVDSHGQKFTIHGVKIND